MNLTRNAHDKLNAVLAEVQKIKHSDFAYSDSVTALDLIEKTLRADLQRLDNLTPHSPENLKIAASEAATTHVIIFMELLGVILRSSNIRNAFEFYSPLQALAKRLIGNAARLILSSEWEYSPLTYPSTIPELPNYVLIGLPASESSNALIIPLAGHELGHSVWLTLNCSQQLKSTLKDTIVKKICDQWGAYLKFYPSASQDALTDLVGESTWRIAYIWAESQCQEVFCDIMGVRLFGESYLYAFEYLLAPNLTGEQSPLYPPMHIRASLLAHFYKHLGWEIPNKFTESFKDEESPFEPGTSESFFLSLAVDTTRSAVDALIRICLDHCNSKGIPLPDSDERDRLYQAFSKLVPATRITNIANIVNAGWKAHFDEHLWENRAAVFVKRRTVLNDLVLKTLEVMEIESRWNT
ncbi:MAG: hypothetical protein ACHQRJ_19125 [Alphaproteobacteria bacterium]